MFYVIAYSYSPNTADTNHNLCYLKGFSEQNIETTYVLIHPNDKRSKWEEPYNNISVMYLWERFPSIGKNIDKSLKYLSYLIFLHLILKKQDIVLLLGSTAYLHSLVKKRGVKVYHERTENPEVVKVNRNKKEYFNDCSRVDGMFVISTALRDYFISKGVSQLKIHIVNMMVDATRFEGLTKQGTEPYIAYCGTASNNKDGVDELIKAFAITEHRHQEFKLYIIGQTPSKDQYFSNNELVKTLNIEDKVVFTGVIPSNKMPQLLKNARILALDRPDNIQAKYGFPTKLGEYLLTENPVVVTRVGDIPFFLNHGDNALIAEPQNPQDFSDKLCWLIEHPDEARKIGARGKNVAMNQFNYLIESKKIISVILAD